jgi:endonuclease YncB( thermonuclease family)
VSLVECAVELGTVREQVRLLDIDAPELQQPFGIEARGTLRSMCPVNSIATVIWKQRDRNGRPLGRVTCSGLNVNAELVRKGAVDLR